MTYANSTYVQTFVGGSTTYNSTELPTAITVADKVVEAVTHTTFSGTIPTPVTVAASMIAARILREGYKDILQVQNKEPAGYIGRLLTPEIRAMLEAHIDTDYTDVYSEDYQ